MIKISETTNKTLIYMNKITDFLAGNTGATKSTVGMLEAVTCQDGLCAVVSGIKVCADSLSMTVFFIFGSNITTSITVPVSFGSKVFVYCCKKTKKIPRGW